MSSPTIPVDIVDEALGECGLDAIGDLTDGSPAALAATRFYDRTLREIHAGAPWNFARRQENMTLLADVTGVLSNFTDVLAPWTYMYEWPIDCVHARFVPAGAPQTTVQVVPIFSSTPNIVPQGAGWSYPTPFLISSSDRPNDVSTNWYLTEGHDPEHTRVILSDIQNASLIYTGIMQYPDAWDPLFYRAMVGALAARLAMPLLKDKGAGIHKDNIMIAKQALDAARVRDGDEGWTVHDHVPDWMQIRTTWGYWGSNGCGCGWMNVPWIDGVY